MATIKAFTDISQSETLSKILPLESADMLFQLGEEKYADSIRVPLTKKHWEQMMPDINPCWSLSALLGTLPFHIIVNNQRYAFGMHKGLNKDGETYMIRYNIFDTDICLYKTEYYNNPVDACVAMIIKLHEEDLL